MFFMNLAYAIKRLSRDVSFSASFVVTMAIGVSFVMAAFSILNAVALRPVLAPNPERLVQAVLSGPGGEYLGVSFPAFDWLRQDHEAADLSAWTGTAWVGPKV
jgi:hypothetical protein